MSSKFIPRKKYMISKKIIVWSILCIWVVLGMGQVSAQLDFIDTDSPNITRNQDDVVNIDTIDGNPIREWTRLPVQSPDGQNDIGIIDQGEIQTYEQWQLQTIAFVRNIINYFLGLLGLVALVIFIVAGFRTVTAWDDDSQYQNAIKDVRRVWIALLGIALSWFIVSFIFYVVGLIVQ